MQDLEAQTANRWYRDLEPSLRIKISHRTFMAVIGVEPLVLEYIWQSFGNCRALPKRRVLLWVFYFMKNYTSLHSTALFFRRTVSHFHVALWTAIEHLAENLDEVSAKI
jgi:hypothetical protein